MKLTQMLLLEVLLLLLPVLRRPPPYLLKMVAKATAAATEAVISFAFLFSVGFACFILQYGFESDPIQFCVLLPSEIDFAQG